MVKITFRPYDEVIIHEVMYSKYDDFLFLIDKEQTIDLRWINGVLFTFYSTFDYPHIIKQKKDRIRNWELLHFTKMPQYQRTIQSHEGRDIIIQNNQGNDLVSSVLEWLKKQPIWNNE